MLSEALTSLVAGAVLSLGACHQQAQQAAGAPESAAVARERAVGPHAAGAATPTISLAPGSLTTTVTPVPTPCGAEKLTNYVNLLPTSTAKGEIAQAIGHHDIRYVPLKPLPELGEPHRVTAELGVDGRIKKFVCG